MFENILLLFQLFLTVLSNIKNLIYFILAIFLSQLAVIITILLPFYLKNIFFKLSTESNALIILFFAGIYGPLKIFSHILKDFVEYFSANFLAETFGEAAKKYFVGIVSSHPAVFVNYSISQIEGAFLSLQIAFSGLVFNFFFILLPIFTSFFLVSGLAFYFLGLKYIFILLIFFLTAIFLIKLGLNQFTIKNKEYGKQHLQFCSIFGDMLLNKDFIFQSNTILEEEVRLNYFTTRRNIAEAELFKFLSLQKIEISLLIGLFSSLFLFLAWSDFLISGKILFVEFFIVIQCVDKFILPASQLNNILFTLFRYYLLFANFFKLMNQVDSIFIEGPEEEIKLNGTFEEILNLQNITVSFENKTLFKNLNYVLKPGTLIVITGENGSGKSTLLKTILGVYSPDEGAVLISGVKTFELFASERSDLFSYVEQHPILFSQTIGFNLFYGHKDIITFSDEIKNFLGLDIFYDLEFWVGKSGTLLSQGEIAKIKLTNAFLKTTKFLLLDEPTAFLDSKSHELFLKILLAQKIRKCLIVSTHDPKIISLANTVIRL